MIFKVLNNMFIISASALIMASCTDNGLLFRSFGGYEPPEDVITYKLGEAYQIKNEWYTPAENYNYNEKGVAGWYQEENGHLTANGEKYDEDALTAMHKTLPLPSIVRITNLENGNVAIVRVNDRGPYVNNRLIDVSQKTAEALEFNMVGTTMVQVEILPEESKLLKKEILKKYGIQNENTENDGESILKSEVKINSLSEPAPLYQPDEGDQVIYGQEDTIQQHEDISSGGIVSVTKPVDMVAQPANVVPMAPEKKSAVLEVKEKSDKTGLITPISGHYVQAGAFSNSDNAVKLKEALDKIGPTQIYETTLNDVALHRVRMGPFENRESALEMLDKLNKAGFQSKIIFEP